MDKYQSSGLVTYLNKNNRHVGDLVNLFSVGCVLDKVTGDTFPMMNDSTIDFMMFIILFLNHCLPFHRYFIVFPR